MAFTEHLVCVRLNTKHSSCLPSSPKEEAPDKLRSLRNPGKMGFRCRGFIPFTVFPHSSSVHVTRIADRSTLRGHGGGNNDHLQSLKSLHQGISEPLYRR